MARRLHPAALVGATAVVVAAAATGCTTTKARAPATTAVAPPAQVAADALHQAAEVMEAVSSYRFVGTVDVGGHAVSIAGEFAAPDRLHETLTLAGQAPVERIAIGATAYQRTGTTWQRVAGQATSGDPRATFAALAHATAVTRQGTGFSFELTGSAAGSLVSGSALTVTGTATVIDGRITDIGYHSAVASGTTVHFTYSEIGTATPVTAPQVAP